MTTVKGILILIIPNEFQQALPSLGVQTGPIQFSTYRRGELGNLGPHPGSGLGNLTMKLTNNWIKTDLRDEGDRLQ